MDQERQHLAKIDSVDMIDYVKKSVEILMSMREDEFRNYHKNWRLQESMREKKDQKQDEVEIVKKYRTPKNSRFFAKMKKETEILVTPKTNKKQLLLQSTRKSGDPDLGPDEYEEVLQKFENDIRKHIRTEQQLKLHVEQT